MKKRYGFIHVDPDDEGNGTLKRRIKDSFEWYRKVIASNGEELQLKQEFCYAAELLFVSRQMTTPRRSM